MDRTTIILYGILGALILIVIGILFFNYFSKEAPMPDNNGLPTDEPIVEEPEPTKPDPIVKDPTPDPDPEPDPQPVVVLPEIERGDTSKKQIILTFDGGAGNHSAQEIIDVLRLRNIKATFFVTGKWASQNPLYLQTIKADGHEVFNHTQNHPDLTTLTDSQIRTEFRQSEGTIFNIISRTTKPYFRPPYGARNARVHRIAAEEGYRSVYWTVDALDWRPGETEETVKKRVFDRLSSGAIYMFHIGDDITGNILDEVISEMKNQGYSIVPLTEGL